MRAYWLTKTDVTQKTLNEIQLKRTIQSLKCVIGYRISFSLIRIISFGVVRGDKQFPGIYNPLKV